MEPERPTIDLPDDDEALLAECDVETFRSGGPGGQHANKVESGVRLRHRPSGLVVVCRQERSQLQNKKRCLAELRRRIARLNERPKARKATRPTTASRRKRRQAKARQSEKKSLRRAPPGD